MWGGAWDVHWLDEVDSTNTDVRARARQGAPAGLVVVADHQTAGRGRLDRRWESPPGANLLASVLLRPSCGAEDMYLGAGAVALAGADACREVAGVEPTLKWPNDLLLDGSKLAGVLAEAEFDGPSVSALVVGIGINVAWPGPPDVHGTCLDTARLSGAPVDRRALLDHLLEALEPRCALLEDGAGRRALAEQVRRLCTTLGQQVRVDLVGEVVTGRAVSIDDVGRLVVETAGAARTISAGDVVHLRPDQGRDGVGGLG